MNPLINDQFVAPKCLEELKWVYEDEHLLVVNKPSGLFTLSGKNAANLDSVHFRLCKDYPEALMIHRLDLGTSGLLVVARSKQIAKLLNFQFQNKQVTKIYEAELFGLLENNEGEINAPIAKDASLFPRLKVCLKSGKASTTYYEVLERRELNNTTLVKFTPVTGRTHQLRIHSQFIGHPIIGCDLYGTEESQQAAKRLKLHAKFLEFKHPVTEEIMSFTCTSDF